MSLPLPRCTVDDITCEEVLQAFAYWQQIKPKGAPAPTRAQLDPLDIPKLLPNTILTELEPDLSNVTFRLVGTQVAIYSGFDFTGRTLIDSIKSLAWQKYWLAIYREIAEEGNCVFGKDRYDYSDKDHITFEWAMMPLSSDGKKIDMTFEVEGYPLANHPSESLSQGTARRFLDDKVEASSDPNDALQPSPSLTAG
ncbi:PAS domain-containing protein [Rhodovibrionaceae bacterium A322]